MMTSAMNMTLSVVTCVCGALGEAHKTDCPMSSKSNIPTEVYSTDSRLSQSDSLWGAVEWNCRNGGLLTTKFVYK